MCNILLLICRSEKYVSATDKHQISLSMFMLVSYHSEEKCLPFDICSLTMKCPWWLITLLCDFAVVLTSVASNLKQINVLRFATEQHLHFLLTKWYTACSGWSIVKIDLQPRLLFFKRIVVPNCKVNIHKFNFLWAFLICYGWERRLEKYSFHFCESI